VTRPYLLIRKQIDSFKHIFLDFFYKYNPLKLNVNYIYHLSLKSATSKYISMDVQDLSV
jgi:hypothetical protein